MSGPDHVRGLTYGIAMAVPFAAVWAVGDAILDLGGGLVVVAAVAGWLIGTSVALGAEPGSVRRERGVVVLAVGVTLGTWVVATLGAYLISMAILPGSTLSLLERMANAPLLEFSASQFLPFGPLELGALALFGWLGAR